MAATTAISGCRRRPRWLPLGVLVALVGVACGGRLTPSQLEAATAPSSAPQAQTSDVASTTTSPSVTSVTDAAAGSTTAPRRATTAVPAGATGQATPAGGNGGATDVGVTPDQVLVGNVSTRTGPVPGLFLGATLGTQAFLAYQNSLGGVHGRQLKLSVADDRLDSGENRAQTAALADKAFAMVGSFSVVDDGGAPELARSGIPDVGYGLGRARFALPNNFSPQPLPSGWRLGPLNYFKARFGDAVVQKMAVFWLQVQSARSAIEGEKAAAQSVGYQFVYQREIAANETNFTGDVLQMQRRGVQGIMMAGDVGTMVRMARAMKEQGFSVPFANWGANAYDPAFVASDARAATNGALIDQQLVLYAGEDAAAVPEVALFLKWLRVVAPGAKPDIFAAFGWASARLFTQALQAAGPRATRAGLLAELRKIDNFDSNGLLAPAGPASKRPPTCFVVVKVENGQFVRAEPAKGMICDKGEYFYLR